MKPMAKFKQRNGLSCSIDPGTVLSVMGERRYEDGTEYTVISHGKDGAMKTAVTATHDQVMEALKFADIKKVAAGIQQEEE